VACRRCHGVGLVLGEHLFRSCPACSESMMDKGAAVGGDGDGFEVQNKGVLRRAPGEGPDGGRDQSQEMDSYDQPQYNESWNGLNDPQGFENQVHQGLTNAGMAITDEGLTPSGLGVRIEWSPGEYGADAHRLLRMVPPGSLLNKLTSGQAHSEVELDDRETEDLLRALRGYKERMKRATPEVELAEDAIEQIERQVERAIYSDGGGF